MTTYGQFLRHPLARLGAAAPTPADRGTAAAAKKRSGRALARTLSRMRPLARTHMIAHLALREHPAERLALAEALAHSGVDALGVHSAIEHLARDPAPQVRRAAARAAWARFSRDPARLVAVLDRLAGDADPEVRALVRLAGGPSGR